MTSRWISLRLLSWEGELPAYINGVKKNDINTHIYKQFAVLLFSSYKYCTRVARMVVTLRAGRFKKVRVSIYFCFH